MKRFLILTALLVMTIGTVGCRNGSSCLSLLPWNRHTECDPCTVECDPCMVDPCMVDPCCPDAGYMQPAMPILPQPGPTGPMPGPQS